MPGERKIWQCRWPRLPHKAEPLISLVHQWTLEMHRRSAAGGEFLSTSKSLSLRAAAFGHVSCFTFWAAAIVKLSMSQEPYRAQKHQRDHAQHAKEMGTLEKSSQGLYGPAFPCLTYLPPSQLEKPHLSASLFPRWASIMRGLFNGASGKQLIIFISLFRSSISA